jgi:hypothetical protein
MRSKTGQVFLAGIAVLFTSLALLYSAIEFFPYIMEDYYNDVFRASSFKTDWLFYAHPFVLCAALRWFWERFRMVFRGIGIVRAIELGLVYGAVSILPVLWLTFSAINVSLVMVITWLVYGIIQATVAGWVFLKLDK